MASVIIRGGRTYREFQSAFTATWPKLRADLFVNDHVYWKEGGGELAAFDAIGTDDRALPLGGEDRISAVQRAVLAIFNVNIEVRAVDGALLEGDPTLDAAGHR